MRISWYAILALLLCQCFTLPASAAETERSTQAVINGTFKQWTPGEKTIAVVISTAKKLNLSLDDETASELLTHALPGDHVKFTVDSINQPPKMLMIEGIYRPTEIRIRITTLILSFGIIYGMAFCMLCKSPFSLLSPLTFLIGFDGPYSKSQTRLALWLTALGKFYGATLVLRV